MEATTMMDTSHSSPELFASFLAAQSEIENATKNAKNPFHKSQYADLNEVLGVVKPAFVKHKLAFMQFPSFDGSLASITTLVANDKGAFISFTSSCVPAKSDAQAIGAASTYLRRYALAGLAGIYQEDDDGNSARHDRKPTPAKAQEKLKPANPHMEAINTMREYMIEGALACGVVGSKSDGVKWFNTLAKTASEKIGKTTAAMDAKEFEQFQRILTEYADEAAEMAGAAKGDANA